MKTTRLDQFTRAQHTPAPWKWWCAKSGRPKKYDLARLDAKSKSVFTVYGGAGLSALGDSPEDRANARLIAAAPELLDALKKLHELACKSGLQDETIGIAWDTIRKATGDDGQVHGSPLTAVTPVESEVTK